MNLIEKLWHETTTEYTKETDTNELLRIEGRLHLLGVMLKCHDFNEAEFMYHYNRS
jgi:hypothetical protein